MAKINYYLKGASGKTKLLELKRTSKVLYEKELQKARPIICAISYEGTRLILFTGKCCSLKHWDKNKQNIKYNLSAAQPTARKLHDWLNDKLDKIQNYIEFQQSNEVYIDKKILKQFFSNNLIATRKLILANLLVQFLKEHKTKSGYSLKPQTESKYKVLISQPLKSILGDKVLKIGIL